MHWCIAHLMHGAAIGRRLAPRGGQIPYPRLRSMFGREGFGAQQARCCCCSSSSREGKGPCEEKKQTTQPHFSSFLFFLHCCGFLIMCSAFRVGKHVISAAPFFAFIPKRVALLVGQECFVLTCSPSLPISLSRCADQRLRCTVLFISLPVSAVSSSPCQSLSLPFSVAVPFLLLLLCFRPRATHAQSRRKRAPQAGAKRKQAENAPHLQEQRRQEAERDDAANDEFPFV